MPLDQSKQTRKPVSIWAVGKTLLLMFGYLFITEVFLIVLEPGITPPGFTGAGVLAMSVVLVGAFHLAGRCRKSWLFLVFGGIAALLLVPAYLGDGRLGLRFAYGYTTITTCLSGWIAFVVAMALLTRMIAMIRWRMVQEVPSGLIACSQCGYDLRANCERCPECGCPFDASDPRTYNGTLRRWEFRWLIRRAMRVLIGVGIPAIISYGYFYWRSELLAIARVEQLGGHVDSVSDLPREWYGLAGPFERLFRHAEIVDFRRTSIADGQLVHLGELHQLQEIHLSNTSITGVGLKPLAGLGKLEHLYVRDSGVNDAGLASIGSLRHLRQLELSETAITDAGMVDLGALGALEILWLDRTPITDKGLEPIGRMANLTHLFLNHTAVTDQGLEHLKGLKKLYTLQLNETMVSDSGLMKLAALPKLHYLRIKGTHVTADGVKKFSAMRPETEIDGP